MNPLEWITIYLAQSKIDSRMTYSWRPTIRFSGKSWDYFFGLSPVSFLKNKIEIGTLIFDWIKGLKFDLENRFYFLNL